MSFPSVQLPGESPDAVASSEAMATPGSAGDRSESLTQPGNDTPMRRRGRPRKYTTPEELAARKARDLERLRAYKARQREQRHAAQAVSDPPKPQREALLERLSPTNQELILTYLDFRGRLLPGTRVAYEHDLAKFALFLEERSLSLLDATPLDVQGWFRDKIRDPLNPAHKADPTMWDARSAQRKLSALRMFYRYATKFRGLTLNPTENAELPRAYVEDPMRLSEGNVLKLFETIERKIVTAPDERHAQLYVLDSVIFTFCYDLALRISDTCNILLSNIMQEDGETRIRVFKKGRKPKKYPIRGIVAEVYERWRQVRRMVPRIAVGHSDFLFIHPWTGRRVSRQRSWVRLRRIAREAGLHEDIVNKISAHKLRHAQAYHMVTAGFPITTVQSVLDHANLATTNIYVRDNEEARLEALRIASEKRLPRDRRS